MLVPFFDWMIKIENFSKASTKICHKGYLFPRLNLELSMRPRLDRDLFSLKRETEEEAIYIVQLSFNSKLLSTFWP